jgi:type I restriction enzyme S subunit
MSHYKPYPEYKDSGIEWIGLMPEHWELKPLKIVASHNDDSLPDSTEPEETISYVDISSASYNEGISKVEEMSFGNAPSRARRKANSGDVIVSTVRTYLKAVASVGDEFAHCIFSTGFAVLRSRPGKLEPKFLKWLVLNDLFIQAVEAHSEGLSYPAINPPTLVGLKTVIPSQEEQKKIASVLESETTRIDTLITKKTRFIELLKEKRQALITHAVTKGLNPNVKMNDSGVEWIGEVPKHWEVISGNRLFSESKQLAFEDDQHLSATQKYGVIPLEEFQELEGRRVTQAVKNLEKRKHARINDFVISMRSFQGGIERVKANGCVRSSYVVLKPTPASHVGYFSYLFKSVTYIQGLQATSMFIRDGQDLSYNNFRQVKVPCPSVSEQAQIADYLDKTIKSIDMLVTKTQRSIDLLKERRSAFITAAVTGQIDMRGEQE